VRPSEEEDEGQGESLVAGAFVDVDDDGPASAGRRSLPRVRVRGRRLNAMAEDAALELAAGRGAKRSHDELFNFDTDLCPSNQVRSYFFISYILDHCHILPFSRHALHPQLPLALAQCMLVSRWALLATQGGVAPHASSLLTLGSPAPEHATAVNNASADAAASASASAAGRRWLGSSERPLEVDSDDDDIMGLSDRLAYPRDSQRDSQHDAAPATATAPGTEVGKRILSRALGIRDPQARDRAAPYTSLLAQALASAAAGRGAGAGAEDGLSRAVELLQRGDDDGGDAEAVAGSWAGALRQVWYQRGAAGSAEDLRSRLAAGGGVGNPVAAPIRAARGRWGASGRGMALGGDNKAPVATSAVVNSGVRAYDAMSLL
jgi:hypothetical protein